MQTSIQCYDGNVTKQTTRWYSPNCMIDFTNDALQHHHLRGTTPSAALQRTIGEARAGAIFALGLAQLVGRETWVNLVPADQLAPDIEVLYHEPTGPRGSNRALRLAIEVVSYTKHSSEDLGDFLFKTKLDPRKKAYGASTAVLCYVMRGCRPEEVRAAHDRLQVLGASGFCYLLGRLDDVRYQTVPVFPTLRGPITVDLAAAPTQVPVLNTTSVVSR